MDWKCDKCGDPVVYTCTRCGTNPETAAQLEICKRALTAVKQAYASHQLYDKFPLPLVEEALSKIKEES